MWRPEEQKKQKPVWPVFFQVSALTNDNSDDTEIDQDKNLVKKVKQLFCFNFPPKTDNDGTNIMGKR